VEEIRAFPQGLAAVQVDDDGATIREMGPGALRVRVSSGGRSVDLMSCHSKSKLLTFPGGRFNTRDEGERARFGAYAPYRRAAEAVTVRAYANDLLDGHGAERAVVVLEERRGRDSNPRTRSTPVTRFPGERGVRARPR
jgi:hypothetical protein